MPQIDDYLSVTVQEKASDFHLCTGVLPAFRIHGTMITATEESAEPFTADTIRDLLKEIMPDANWKEYEEAGDTDFAYAIDGAGRFRVNAFVDHNGPGAVFRHIPNRILSLEDLHMPPVVKRLCELRKGLVLVTGPTGSGKTTTLAAMIDYINKHRQEHIVTIEDPIEFLHENRNCLINQREVKKHTESFQKALRAALREDPDIVLVGEMRDLETTATAIETAETGHLVLATLHTTTATSTVDRIIDQFPADRQGQIRTMLASTLKGVVSQSLLKRKDGEGRVAGLEILIVTAGVAANIREGKTHQLPSALQTGGAYGMQMLNGHLLQLVQAGIVDPDEAYRHSVDKAGMAARLNAAGMPTQTDVDETLLATSPRR